MKKTTIPLLQVWRVLARSSPPPWTPHWRERLAASPGYKSRRSSPFTESVLYGVMDCLSTIAEQDRSSRIQRLSTLRLTTINGTYTSTRKVIDESLHELPMPFTFLQSQFSQALAALARVLAWEGDASIITTENEHDFVTVALLASYKQAGTSGDILLGWAEELQGWNETQNMQWVWLSPCEEIAHHVFSKDSKLTDRKTQYVTLTTDGIMYSD